MVLYYQIWLTTKLSFNSSRNSKHQKRDGEPSPTTLRFFRFGGKADSKIVS
jgi:hypothetical protein